MNLGNRLRIARKKRELKQTELSELVPGASQQEISALENRGSETSILLFELADALQINPRWLLTGDGESGLDRPWIPHQEDPLFQQLAALYNGLDPDRRHQLLSNANWLHSQQHPQPSTANPFGQTKLLHDKPVDKKTSHK